MKQQKEKQKEKGSPIIIEESKDSFSVGVGSVLLSSSTEPCQVLSGLLISILENESVKKYLQIF